MIMQPLVAGEPWSVLTSLFVEFDDGDAYPSNVLYELEEAEDVDARPLLRSILRVAADLLVAEADHLHGNRCLVVPDSERLLGDACEALFLRLHDAIDTWTRSTWFAALSEADRTRMLALAVDLDSIADRVQARDLEIQAWVAAMFSASAAV